MLGRPRLALALVLAVVAAVGSFAPRFALDASADSLLLENDESLRYYREIRARYGSDDFLFVTYTPDGELFSPAVLDDLAALRESLAAVDGVPGVTSVLDVPLLRSPPLTLTELADHVPTLSDPRIDVALARAELITSPLYRGLLVSEDGRTTALRVDLARDETYESLLTRREALRQQARDGSLSPAEAAELDDVSRRFRRQNAIFQDEQERLIADVRAVLDGHRDRATLYLGGVPMIVADSIEFIRRDLVSFGLAVIVFVVVILAAAFRRPRWVVLPLATCLLVAVTMTGLLGLIDWRVTVVSSNFIALLLILTLSLALHLIVRYRELHELNPESDQRDLVRKTVSSKVVPCLYTTLTTMVAFGSLVISGIRPVMDFGWIMVIGLGVAFLVSFTFFPASLVLLPAGRPQSRKGITASITLYLARFSSYRNQVVLGIFTFVGIVAVLGTFRLTVENRFIDYYRETTEIYQGMELIDRHLGGTTPLDVVIDAPPGYEDVDLGLDDDFDESFMDPEEADPGITATSYWFNHAGLAQAAEIHDYLDGLGQTGKVISLGSVAEILAQVDPVALDDDFRLSVLHRRLPPEVIDTLLIPYLSPDGDQARFSVRVFESDPGLRRGELIATIREHLVGPLGLAPESVHLTGMLVLYNNMLESLFRSQMLTLGGVFFAIFVMFLVLFRSFHYASLAIVPNLLSAALVLGLMGWLDIPLDIMTITIAAITIGIAVDDTIHYVHRFRVELASDGDYWAAVIRSHRSIGRAMYYTTVTIMLGFSVLAVSNFVPTVYLGLLTGFAMFVGLIANVTLLPVLLVRFRGRSSPLA